MNIALWGRLVDDPYPDFKLGLLPFLSLWAGLRFRSSDRLGAPTPDFESASSIFSQILTDDYPIKFEFQIFNY